MIDRPLVFGTVPSIMVSRDRVSWFLDFFKLKGVQFEAFRFQQNFHLVRFPSITGEDLEELLDRLARSEN